MPQNRQPAALPAAPAHSPGTASSGADQGGCTHGIRPPGEGWNHCGSRFPAARLRDGASPTSDATCSSVPALLVGAERANQAAEGHSHLNTAKPSSHWELANISPSSSASDVPQCGAKVVMFFDWQVAS